MLAMGAAGSNTNEGVNVGLTWISATGLGTASGYFWWYGT